LPWGPWKQFKHSIGSLAGPKQGSCLGSASRPDSGGSGRRRRGARGGGARGGPCAPVSGLGAQRGARRRRRDGAGRPAASCASAGRAPGGYGGGDRAEEDQGGKGKVLVGLLWVKMWRKGGSKCGRRTAALLLSSGEIRRGGVEGAGLESFTEAR
jgi:hypothetical protein